MLPLAVLALDAALVAAVLLVAGCGVRPVALDPAGLAQLSSLDLAPERAGALIYRGRVDDPHAAADAAPLFRYERRVADTPAGLQASHITRDPQGRPIIVEQVRLGPGQVLQRFDAINAQAGYSGSVLLSRDGRQLDYRLQREGRASVATEQVRDPVVAGPSLHGYILSHWEPLLRGQVLPVRMIVLAEQRSYGFEIRRQASDEGRTMFSVTPSDWWVRLAVAPLALSFDTSTRQPLRYEGRVPPLRPSHGRLRDFDARVDYTMHDVYR